MNALDNALIKRFQSFIGQKIEGIITSNLMHEDPYICFIQPDGPPRGFTLEFEHSDFTLLCSLHEVENGNNFYKIETKERAEIIGNVILRIKVNKKIDNIEYFLRQNKLSNYNDIGAFIFHYADRSKMLFQFGSFLPQLSITTNFNEIETEIRTLNKEGFTIQTI